MPLIGFNPHHIPAALFFHKNIQAWDTHYYRAEPLLSILKKTLHKSVHFLLYCVSYDCTSNLNCRLETNKQDEDDLLFVFLRIEFTMKTSFIHWCMPWSPQSYSLVSVVTVLYFL